MSGQSGIQDILLAVREGRLSVEEAEGKIRYKPLEDLGFAMLDYHRELRTGVPEVVYGSGKTAAQVAAIAANMKANGAAHLLVTRATPAMAEAVRESFPGARHHEAARLVIADEQPFPKNRGVILVASGGTSDLPVCEEAALTAEYLGNRVRRLYDVGVAGLHRLLSHLDEIKAANVIIVVAGMEGALASVVGGLTDKPVIAVPTSVGYGANFGGLSALLCMLNSCASGVGVVNIDNGFGAGYLAHNINKLSGKE